MTIKAISLWQPWASLIFARDSDGRRIKFHETRSWSAPKSLIGTRIVIHAAKTMAGHRDVSPELHEVCMDVWGCNYNHSLPYGAALGHVVLAYSLPTGGPTMPATDDDRHAGNWAPGRFCWLLDDATPFPNGPIACKGAQGFWNWK